MKTRPMAIFGLMVGVALLVALMPSGAVATPQLQSSSEENMVQSSPVMFIENVGQFNKGARFRAFGGQYNLWLAEDALWLVLVEPSSKVSQPEDRFRKYKHFLRLDEEESRLGVAVKLTFPGANPNPHLEPFNRLETKVSYFIGNDPEKWHPNVPVWGGVRYRELFPSVDLEVTSESGRWTWQMIAREDADLSTVSLRVEGADKLAMDDNHLNLTTAFGDLILPLLIADWSGPTSTIVGRDVLHPFIYLTPNSTDHFTSPIHNHQTIRAQNDRCDLVYGTFLGEWEDEHGFDIAIDEEGNAYVTGVTESPDFPTTPGAFDTGYNSSRDAFVAKLNASGSGLIYSTFLGGSSYDYGYSLAVDEEGNVYVTGETESSDFPTTPGAFDRSYNSSRDAFVAKLNASGSGLIYATFLGGSHPYSGDIGSDIAIDEQGNAYVMGTTSASDFPTTVGAFDTSLDGYSDAFVTKLNADGSDLVYSTFLGGGDQEYGCGIAVDAAGQAYVTGGTKSPDFPTTPGAFDRSYNNGHADAFVAKLNASGSGLIYSTFLGGDSYECSNAIDIDREGSTYVTGWTSSPDFPTTPGAFDRSFDVWHSDAFVAKLNASGSGLIYSTFLGGWLYDRGSAIGVDGEGSAYVTGTTDTCILGGFPTTPGAFQRFSVWGDEVFVAKLALDDTLCPEHELQLAERFVPYMYFHQDDIYRPISISVPVEKAKQLYGEGVPPDTSPTLDELASPQWRERENAYLDLKGNGKEELHNVYLSEISSLVEPLALAQVDSTSTPGKIAIQYWLFYYDNPWRNHHEGDWEMVQVVLDSNETPLYVVYSQHVKGSKRWWSDIERVGEHPVVYVAKGSHASYFKPYDYFQIIGVDETAPVRAAGVVISTMLPKSPTQDTWLYFKGHWGDKGKGIQWPYLDEDGPRGPSQKGEKWSNPVAWSKSLPWDEEAHHNLFRKLRSSVPSPLDVHLYELPSGAHVGWKEGGVEEGIPHAEYFDNPATGWRTVLLHKVKPEAEYKVELGYRAATYQVGTQTASEMITVTLSFPDVEASTVITTLYSISDTWGVSTTAAISIYHGSDFHMLVDIDGDEMVDEEVRPTVMEETSTDFTAPSVITDLKVLVSTIDTVILTWTSPGDDGYTGKATAYDPRYYTDPITESNWVSATRVISPPVPSVAGTTEVFTVTGVSGGVYYFAIKTVDDLLQSSGLSNVVETEVPYGVYLPVVLRNR